ncbi:MAG: periplasmic heavy metal sensor [Hyphomicrobium sp.]
MTIDMPDAPRPRSRWLYAGLVASLAVNLLFAGWVGGAMWHHRKDPAWRGGGGGERGLLGFVRQLPEDRRPALRARIKAARDMLKPLKDELEAAWTAANATLVVEPFDKAASKAAFTKAIDADVRLRSAIDDELLATVEGLSAEERKILQTWREKRKSRMPHRHGRKDRLEGKDSTDNKPDDKDKAPE